MNYPILSRSNTSIKEFINFWNKMYHDSLKDLYLSRIDKKRFTADDVFELFKWKNGGNLSQRKKASVKRIVDKLDIINKLKEKYDAELFEVNFKMSAIWKIFLRHIIVPNKCPIFDQHVYRAYHYLECGTINEISTNTTDRVKEVLYVDYVAFVNKIAEQGINRKKIDEALWAFGKFLKSNYSPIIKV